MKIALVVENGGKSFEVHISSGLYVATQEFCEEWKPEHDKLLETIHALAKEIHSLVQDNSHGCSKILKRSAISKD